MKHAFLFILISLLSLNVRSQEGTPAVLTANLGKTNNLVLELTIQNSNSRAIKVFPGEFPWDPRAMIIAAYSTRFPGGQRLTNALVVETSRPLSPGSIAPGERLSGKIDLMEIFPSIADDIKKYDIVVFWSFDLTRWNERLSRTNGSFTLAASRF